MKYRRSYRTKKKISIWVIFKNKFFWFGFFILVVISGLIYFFIFSSVFQIKDVQVSGAEKSPKQEIKNIISAKSRNIFLTNLEIINKNLLEKYPQIAEIILKRKLPNTILVQVEERKPIAFFCGFVDVVNDCYFLDKEGIIFEKVNNLDKDLLIFNAEPTISEFNLGQEVVKIDYLEKVLKINSQLRKEIKIKEVSLVSNNRLNIKTLEGWEIYFNPKENLDWQIEEIKILLEQKISPENRENLEYVDLRFEKVYIYPENR